MRDPDACPRMGVTFQVAPASPIDAHIKVRIDEEALSGSERNADGACRSHRDRTRVSPFDWPFDGENAGYRELYGEFGQRANPQEKEMTS